ncbi:methyl-accepting chemotaxis protein [Roseateles cellulosilyticus]|uniref:Methyl-accepting chemotaxis protein n=1 Tax=Pelomonas cellulosilytica TaxID=2906762 RepID=A0ABS8Y0F5_9BURK|nr:methyl-accepting chemotaxis protein [Pelomonas sp. P8]
MSTKLIGGFVGVVLMGTLVAAVGIFGMHRINEYNDALYQRELLGISYVKEANINLIYAGRARANFMLATSEDARTKARGDFDKAVADLRRWLEKSRPLFVTDKGKALYADTIAVVEPWLAAVTKVLNVASTRPYLSNDAELQALVKASSQLNRQLDEQLTALTKEKESLGLATAQEGLQLYERLSWLMIGLTVFSGLFGLVVGVMLTRGLNRQLGGEPGDVAALAGAIAQGDLTTSIDVSEAKPGSVVAAMDGMQRALRDVVASVRAGSESIATASAQIAQGNSDLSQRTEEQASALEETSATMQQLNATVRATAESAHQADSLARASSAKATEGGGVVDDVVQTMRGIQQSSGKIAEIINVIDGIAFQTNILALNAAVEAARAGEQGRGFAVVAGEVRTLAQRSATAAREIKSLITASVEQIEQGTTQVDTAGAAMQDIVGSIQRVADIVGEISSASREQSTGVSQVEGAVAQMDQVTQQNAALVEQSAAAAESLRQQAQQLLQAVAVFKLQRAAP